MAVTTNRPVRTNTSQPRRRESNAPDLDWDLDWDSIGFGEFGFCHIITSSYVIRHISNTYLIFICTAASHKSACLFLRSAISDIMSCRRAVSCLMHNIFKRKPGECVRVRSDEAKRRSARQIVRVSESDETQKQQHMNKTNNVIECWYLISVYESSRARVLQSFDRRIICSQIEHVCNSDLSHTNPRQNVLHSERPTDDRYCEWNERRCSRCAEEDDPRIQ